MPIVSETNMLLALKNISSFGDTDIFPFPVENHLFHDMPGDVVKVLLDIDKNFDESISKFPVLTSKELAGVGYSGFRQGTQIDPLWNAYLLALVISIAQKIESKRVKSSIVFSYRFKPDRKSGTLFDRTIGWNNFQAEAKRLSESHDFVLRCDISDFYPRIYHHRLENALVSATSNPDIVRRVMKLLTEISEGPSYGLPVGGAASRILSEILLNRVDRLLIADGIEFIRFVDDYLIFTNSREDAQSALISLTKNLLKNEGLSLQKAKTRVMSAAEFLATSDFSPSPDGESPEDERARTFRRLRVHFDPYSPTADADYKKLAKQLSQFDILGMLGRELAKSRIDEGLTKRLVSAIRHLKPRAQNDAVLSMIGSLDLLYPIFPSVMLLFKSLLSNLDMSVKHKLFSTLRLLVSENSYITQVPANLAFVLRIIGLDEAEETEVLLARIYRQSTSMMIRRDVILVMANRSADYWVSNCRTTFSTVTSWERRALLIGSYMLGDEGKHWRESIKKDQNAFDQVVMSWAAANKNKKKGAWRVPI